MNKSFGDIIKLSRITFGHFSAALRSVPYLFYFVSYSVFIIRLFYALCAMIVRTKLWHKRLNDGANSVKLKMKKKTERQMAQN
jgi:hypothetical protein